MMVRIMLIGWLAAAIVPAATAQAPFPLSPPPALRNAGFEEPAVPPGAAEFPRPEGWSCFASVPGEKIAVTATGARSGAQALVFPPVPAHNAFEGAAQEFPVQPGHHYEFAVHARSDSADRLAADSFGQIHFEWRGADGKEVSRTYGPTWAAGLSAKQWERFFVEGDAPERAVSGLAVIMFYSRNGGGRGTFYVDDCQFTGGPPPQAAGDPGSTSRMQRLEKFRQARGSR